MYEKTFHLQKSPFAMTPDPGFLMMTASHLEVLSGLVYAVYEGKGFVVVTGEAGTGKTSLVRALMRTAKSAHFSLILDPILSLDEFLEMVLLDFGITDVPASKTRRLVALQDLFAKLHEEGKTPVLIVDEAHILSPEVLEEVRLLTNFETDDRKLLQIILVGQTELDRVLNQTDLRQLKQRIELRLELKPLSLVEVADYLRHRWKQAGGLADKFPFSAEAIPLIAEASRGVPRLINAICDNALLLAFADEVFTVTPDHIKEAVTSLDLRNCPETPDEAGTEETTVSKHTDNGSARDKVRNSTARPSLLMRWAEKMCIGQIQMTRTADE